MGVPFQVALSAISFLYFQTKKDAATIPNAAFNKLFKKRTKQAQSFVKFTVIAREVSIKINSIETSLNFKTIFLVFLDRFLMIFP